MSFTLGPGVPPTGARLAVVWWHQRNGDFDEYRQIAYDVAIDPSTGEVEIPFSELALPFAENLICFRDCTDRALCDCRSPEVAVASVMVALDLNADGALSLSELRAEQVGGAVALIGWAPEAQNGFPRGFQGLFDIILAGFSAYTEIPLVPATADVAYPIQFCPAGDSACQFPVTRLLCHRDCERDWGLNRFGI